MDRAEFVRTKCRRCWWAEGMRCYNEDVATITQVGSHRYGQEIDAELIASCVDGFRSKRDLLESVLGPDVEIIIASEVIDGAGNQ